MDRHEFEKQLPGALNNLRRILEPKVPDENDIDDIVQQVSVELTRKFIVKAEPIFDLSALVVRIGYQRLMDYYREKYRHAVNLEKYMSHLKVNPRHMTSAYEETIQKMAMEEIAAKIDQFSPQEKQLIDYMQSNPKDAGLMAKKLGTSKAMIYRWASRLRARIVEAVRRIFEQDEEDGGSTPR